MDTETQQQPQQEEAPFEGKAELAFVQVAHLTIECGNPECKTRFGVADQEACVRYHQGQGVSGPCPKCQKQTRVQRPLVETVDGSRVLVRNAGLNRHERRLAAVKKDR